MNNCYSAPARLFVSRGLEVTSSEGSTQGDTLGMAIYAVRITSLLDMLVAMQNDHNKMVRFADGVTASRNLEELRRWRDTLMQICPNYGYYPESNKLKQVVGVFGGTNIQMSSEGNNIWKQ